MRRICLNDIHLKTTLCLNCHQPLAVEMISNGALRQSLDRVLEKGVAFKGVFHTGNTGKCEFVIGAEVPAAGLVENRETIEGVLCVGRCTCGHADEMLLAVPYSQWHQMKQ